MKSFLIKFLLQSRGAANWWLTDALILTLALVMLIGFLSGKKKKIKPALYFYSVQIIWPFLVMMVTYLPVSYHSDSGGATLGVLRIISMIVNCIFAMTFDLGFGATVCYGITAFSVGIFAVFLSANIWSYLLIIIVSCLISLAIALIAKRRMLKRKK